MQSMGARSAEIKVHRKPILLEVCCGVSDSARFMILGGVTLFSNLKCTFLRYLVGCPLGFGGETRGI